MEISHGCQDGGGAEYRWFLALAGGAVAKETSAEIASRNSDNAMPFPKEGARFGFTFVGDKVRRFRSGAARVSDGTPSVGSFAAKRGVANPAAGSFQFAFFGLILSFPPFGEA